MMSPRQRWSGGWGLKPAFRRGLRLGTILPRAKVDCMSGHKKPARLPHAHLEALFEPNGFQSGCQHLAATRSHRPSPEAFLRVT